MHTHLLFSKFIKPGMALATSIPTLKPHLLYLVNINVKKWSEDTSAADKETFLESRVTQILSMQEVAPLLNFATVENGLEGGSEPLRSIGM